MLGSMKGIKLTGLTDRLQILIQGLRVSEVNAAKAFRLLGVYTSTLGKTTVRATLLDISSNRSLEIVSLTKSQDMYLSSFPQS